MSPRAPAKKPYRIGDVFGIPLPKGQWCVGRVVFDPWTQLLKPGLAAPKSHLVWHRAAVLIDVFEGLHASPAPIDADLLVRGMFVDTRAFERDLWPIVGHAPIDPTQVEFPETLLGEGLTCYFRRGELDLPTTISGALENAIDCRSTDLNSLSLDRILLTHLERPDLIDKPGGSYHLRRSDLRFHSRRAEVYTYLDLDPDAAYYPTALARGFDLARLYP